MVGVGEKVVKKAFGTRKEWICQVDCIHSLLFMPARALRAWS